MKLDFERTIVALASPLAAGQRAIVRISGSKTKHLLRQVLREPAGQVEFHGGHETNVVDELLNSSTARYSNADIDLNWEGRQLPAGVYYWPTVRSFTGQPSAELHFIGSIPLAQKVIERLTQAGAHPAERGEFTMRGFLNGKMDLTQVEAVLGVIESVEGSQLEWSLGQLGGNLSQPVKELRCDLINLLSDLEASLDFAEEDIQFITSDQTHQELCALIDRIEQMSALVQSRGTPVRPLQIALAGLPNAGKSSLFNALLAEDRSITSPQSGTTRDAVSGTLTLGGSSTLQVSLVDTAGIESSTDDSPRALAQRVLHDQLSISDMVLLCIDLSDCPPLDWIQEQSLKMEREGRKVVCVGTKADLIAHPFESTSMKAHGIFQNVVSVHRSESVEELRRCLSELCELQDGQQYTHATHQTAVRFRHSMDSAKENLLSARRLIEEGQGLELVASELHLAVDELGAIIGQVHNDDILGLIFSRFCIGK